MTTSTKKQKELNHLKAFLWFLESVVRGFAGFYLILSTKYAWVKIVGFYLVITCIAILSIHYDKAHNDDNSNR